MLKAGEGEEDIENEESDDPAKIGGVPVLTDRVSMNKKVKKEESSDDEEDKSNSDSGDGAEVSFEEDNDDEMGDENDEESDSMMQEVKLCSKHAAFIRHRPDEGFFIHYATQNERCQ